VHPGVFARYDVFDREGHLRKEVRLRGEVRQPEDGFLLLAVVGLARVE